MILFQKAIVLVIVKVYFLLDNCMPKTYHRMDFDETGESSEKRIGFIAQNIAEICPDPPNSII